MTAIYNEIEPFAASLMRKLIEAGHIAPGVVDERSILELEASDLAGAGQRHFFAGAGVWSYALRLAGIPDSSNIWTGSCPCQPFSGAGNGSGLADERHLWPIWFGLIAKCRPPIIFGEQVASPDGLKWLDLVRADLEGADYAFGAADLCAAGVGAPHIRQRLYFVAHASSNERQSWRSGEAHEGAQQSPGRGDALRLGDADGLAGGWDGRAISREEASCPNVRSGADGSRPPGEDLGAVRGFWSDAEWIDCLDGKARPVEPGTFPLAHGAPARVGRLRVYGNAIVPQVAATFIRAALDI